MAYRQLIGAQRCLGASHRVAGHEDVPSLLVRIPADLAAKLANGVRALLRIVYALPNNLVHYVLYPGLH